MKGKIKFILDVLYWIWIMIYFSTVMAYIIKLKIVSLGEEKIFMAIATFFLFVAGSIVYFLSLNYKSSKKIYNVAKLFFYLFSIIIILVFFYVLKENSKIILYS